MKRLSGLNVTAGVPGYLVFGPFRVGQVVKSVFVSADSTGDPFVQFSFGAFSWVPDKTAGGFSGGDWFATSDDVTSLGVPCVSVPPGSHEVPIDWVVDADKNYLGVVVNRLGFGGRVAVGVRVEAPDRV